MAQPGYVIIHAKQKHLGCKKVRGQSEVACKQADVTQSIFLRLALSLGHLFTKGGQVTKPIMKICYKLLYVILGVKSIFDKVTSWPHMPSKLLIASACLHPTSDWPRTFFTPKVFLFSISLHFVKKYHYFVEAYKQMLL